MLIAAAFILYFDNLLKSDDIKVQWYICLQITLVIIHFLSTFHSSSSLPVTKKKHLCENDAAFLEYEQRDRQIPQIIGTYHRFEIKMTSPDCHAGKLKNDSVRYMRTPVLSSFNAIIQNNRFRK